MPNTLAYVVFYGWPLVVLILFRKMPLPAALAWSIVAGYLLLPERVGIDWPMVPTINKYGLPALIAAVMCLVVAGTRSTPVRRPAMRIEEHKNAVDIPSRRAARKSQEFGLMAEAPLPAIRGGLILRGLLALMLIAPVLTVLENPEPVIAGWRFIPGLRIYDAFSIIGELAITILPFLLAKKFLATEESHLTLLKVLCLASLGYSVLALYEIRMSPQLNIKIYGFFAHDFFQQVRGDGFRPMVFMPHGLWLAIFQAMGVLAAATLWRTIKANGGDCRKWQLATWYLLAVLILGKSFGAIVLVIASLPCVLFLNVRAQMIVAACISIIILLYPALRSSGMIPTQYVLSAAQAFSEARASSLQTRLTHEDALLARAHQKPLAGWGTWGRNRIYLEDTGQDLSLTDGMWVILIGTYGWLGYIAQFGLIALPTLLLLRLSPHLSLATSGLSLVLAANLLDLIPNATLTAVTWLVGGALFGRYATLRAKERTMIVRSDTTRQLKTSRRPTGEHAVNRPR